MKASGIWGGGVFQDGLDTKLDYQFSVEFCVSNKPYEGDLSYSPRSGIILTIKHLTQDQ